MGNGLSTRREFLKKAGMAGAFVTLGGLAEPLLGGATKVFAATGESTQEIINYALTAEQLATTFYYTGINSHLGIVTNAGNKPYLQAALAAEYYHVQLLSGAGAQSLVGETPSFYFPSGTFTKPDTFLAVLDALETAFIEAYLEAIYQFASNGRDDLAELAGQILGVESEHRVLGRQIAGFNAPNNLLLETAAPSGTTVAGVGQALFPFVSQSSNNPDGPYMMPTQDQITAAVGNVLMASPAPAGKPGKK